MDKEDSPGESNDSDSEDTAVDEEKALVEKEKVKHLLRSLKSSKTQQRLHAPSERGVPLLLGQCLFQRWEVRRRHWVLYQRDVCKPFQPGPPHKQSHRLLQTQEVSQTQSAAPVAGACKERRRCMEAALPQVRCGRVWL